MPMTDERIVKMRFDNSKFERNIAKSQNSVEKFKQALNFDETSRGIEKFSKATNGLDFSHFFNNIQKLTDRFTGLGDAGDYVLRRIRAGFDEVAMSVERFIKDITLAQMTIGQGKYDSLNRAVQTIVASGSNTEKEAYDVMDRVMVYTDQTSHNFETMVSQISALTSKGVGLEKAERLMEGFANASTKAGAEAGRAATAMQVYTKAMGSFLTKNEFDTLNLTARVVTKEWREELIAAGLAAKDLEKDTKGNIKTAKKYGKQVVVTADTLEDTLSKKWASKNTLAIFGERYMFGDTLDELRHPEEAMDSFGKTAYMTGQRALTFADAMNAIKESISSGWMQSYRIIFGDLSEAMEIFTNICDRVIDSIEEIADIRNRILRQWKLSGGRDSLLEILFGDFDKDTRDGAYGLIDVLDDVGKLIYSGIADFFGIFADPDDRYMFHKDPTYLASWLGIQAANIGKAVQDFMQSIRNWFDEEIKIGDKTTTRMEILQNVISGLVSVLALGIMLIDGIATFISDIATQLEPSITKILGFFDELGKKIYGDTFNAKKENTIVAFFHELAETFRPVTEGINEVVSAIVDLLHELLGIDKDKNNTGNFFKNLGEGLKMVAKIISSVGKPVFKFLRGIIETIGVFLKGGINATTMREAGEKFGASFNEFIIGIGEALPESFGFLKEWIQNLFGTGEQEVKEGSESLLEIIGQTNKDAKNAQKKSSDGGLGINSILNGSNIAVWLGVGGLLGLDLLINRARKAIKGVQWFVEELGSSLKKGFRVQYDNNAEYFYKIAKAVALICAAVVILGSMPINKLLQGAAAVAVVMGVMFILFKLLKERTAAAGWKDTLGYAGQLAAVAFGLSALAIAIGVLSLALIPFSLMSWEGIGKAMVGLAGVLLELVGFIALLKIVDAGIDGIHLIGIVAFAFGIGILVKAIQPFANMTDKQSTRALNGLMNVLIQLIAFMGLMRILDMGVKSIQLIGIVSFAAAIAILVYAIQPFATLNANQYNQVLNGLMTVLLQLIAFMGLMRILDIGTKGIQLIGIIGFSVAIAILVQAIQPFATLNINQYNQVLYGLMTVLLQLIGFMGLMRVLDIGTKGIQLIGIIGFSLAIAILVQAIQPFANLNINQYNQVLYGLMTVLLQLVAFMALMKVLNIGVDGIKLAGIIFFTAGIAILVQAIQPFAALTPDQYNRVLNGLMNVLLQLIAFMGLMKLLQVDNLKIVAIVGFAAGISALVTAIQPFAGMTWDEYAVVMAGLGGVLLELIGFMALLKALDMKNKNLTQVLIIAAALSTMAVAFGLALNLVKGMDYMTIAAFANGLSVAIVALAGAIAICSKFGSIKGVLIMAAGLAAIIAVIALLGPWLLSSIGSGLADMSSRLATMADMFEIFSTRMNGVDDGAINKAKTMIDSIKDLLGDIGTFGKISVSSSAFSVAMFNLGTGLEMLNNHTRGIKGMDENEAFSLITGLASCSRDLDVIAKMDIKNLTSNISGLGGALSIYAEGANAAGGITTDDQVKDVKDVIEFMKEITKTIGEDAGVLELPDNLPDASSLGTFGAQLAALATALSDFEKASRGFGGHTDKALKAIEFFRDLKRELDMYNTVNDLSYITELNDGFVNQGVTVTSLQTFGANIEQLGSALNQFVLSTTEKDEVTGEVKAKPYEAGIAALEQFAALQARLEAIKFGGVISWIEGEGRKIEDLGNSIQMLGSQLMTFSNKLTGRGAEGEAGVTFDSTVAQQAVDSMTTILGFLIKFNNKMGRIGGFWNIVKNFAFGRLYNLEDIGDQFGKFGDGLATLGTGLANEGWKSIDKTTVDLIIGTMDSLIDFLNNANDRLPTIGGLEEAWNTLWHGHDYSFEDLSKQIGKMGDGIGQLGTGLTVGGWSKISGDATNAAFGAIESILKIMIQIGKLQNTAQDVPAWGGNMYAGAEDLVQFIDYIGNTDTAGLESIAEMIRLVDSVMDEWEIDVGHITAFKEMCEALASLATVDPSYDWKNIGLSIDTGIAAGLRENKTIVSSAAEEVALAAYTAAMAKLNAHSPSKVFMGVGTYISEGMAIGIVQSAGEVTGSVDEMSEMAINTAKDAMASVSRALAEDVSSHPTITPVLDLSNVNAGMADLNRNFGSRSISVEPGSYNRPGIIRPDTSISKADMIGNTVNMSNEVARSLGEIAAKSNDPAIKEAFNKIVEANNEMNEKVLKKLENMQIVLDSGAIAGGVTDTVDGNIGRKTFYATRRN